MTPKTMSLPDFLTIEQIKQCIKLYPDRIKIRDQVLLPNMEVINKKLGQENDADYLSYAIIFVFDQVNKLS